MRFPALLVAAAFLAYAPVLRAPAAYDDAGWVLRNPKLTDPGALLQGFWDPSVRAVGGVRLPAYAYRPLTEASFALNFALWPSIAGLRAGNLLIHASASMLVFLLIRRLAGEGAARWGALFFAVHPLGVQAVAYVYQRSVCLAAALSFLCLLLYLSGRTRWALAAAIGAAMSKETAAVLPLSLAVVEAFRADREWRRLLPFLSVPALVGVMALRAGSDANPHLGPLEYLLAQGPAVLGYLRLHLLPFPMGFVHPRPLAGEVEVLPALAAWAVLLALSGWIVLGPERHRTARMGLALVLAPLALESSVLPIEDVAWSYRCYPGLLGAGILCGLAGWRLLLPLLFFAGLTVGESRLWASPYDLPRRDVRFAPRAPEVRGDFAAALLDRGGFAGAERICRGVRLHPKVRASLARALSGLGRGEEARALLGEDPDSEIVLLEAVDEAGKRGDREALDRMAAKVEAMESPGPMLILWLARRKAEGGDPAGGEGILRAHEAGLRGNALYWDHLGQMLLVQKKDAEGAYRKAVALDPALWKSWNNLGLILAKRGDRRGAADAFRKALEAKPDYELARKNLDAVER